MNMRSATSLIFLFGIIAAATVTSGSSRFDRSEIVPAGETIRIVASNIRVLPIDMDDPRTDTCDIVQGDTIRVERADGNRVLVRLVGNVQKKDQKKIPRCSLGILFFLDKTTYLRERTDWLIFKQVLDGKHE
jgi:hypothetical protein